VDKIWRLVCHAALTRWKELEFGGYRKMPLLVFSVCVCVCVCVDLLMPPAGDVQSRRSLGSVSQL
jgi:hypothetical protein